MSNFEFTSVLRGGGKISKNSFEFSEVIGTGGFGKVYKCSIGKSPIKYYAVKELSKAKIIEKNDIQNVFKERDILIKLFHPFIINMHCCFQDQDNLYMVMDYCPCSDLRYQLGSSTKLSEPQIKFVAACTVLGLEYIHSKGFAHLDIKPENLICDDKGYFRITDFGISSSFNDRNPDYEMTGTPGYIAPEANSSEKPSFETDYFSLGVMLYEIITGEIPYKQHTKEEMEEEFEKIKICLKPEECGYSKELCDFVNKLTVIDRKKRLGRKGDSEVKLHPFFKQINWQYLRLRKTCSPFTPKPFNQKKFSYSNSFDTDDSETTKSDEDQSKFNNFTFMRSFLRLSKRRNNSTEVSKIISKESEPQSQSQSRKNSLKLATITNNNIAQRNHKRSKFQSSGSLPKLRSSLPIISSGSTMRNSSVTKEEDYVSPARRKDSFKKSSVFKTLKPSSLSNIKPMRNFFKKRSCINIQYGQKVTSPFSYV